MTRHLQNDLQNLKGMILSMGETIAERARSAITALLEYDPELAQR